MFRRLLALAVLLALAGAWYYWKLRPGEVPQELGALGHTLADAKLHAAVKAAFELNRRLHALSVTVEAEDGVLTLRGEVPDDETRALAEQTAAAVPGVKQLVSHLRLAPGGAARADDDGSRSLGESFDDEALAVKVRLALSLRADLHGARIDVRVRRRVVTLSGEARSQAQREAALALAREVRGVAEVVDRLRVQAADAAAEPVSDRRAAVLRALRANPSLSGYAFETREERGELVLSGRVGTAAERDLAGALAREAARGPVTNAVAVSPPGAPR